MGLRSKKEVAAPNLTASAMRFTVINANMPNRSYVDETWQREGWRFYDSGGELHFAADYVGAACSQVRLYIAHVDEYGVMQQEVDDEPEVGAIAHNIFGGPAATAEMLRLLGISLTVAGDCWLVARSKPSLTFTDTWTVIAPYMGRPYGGRFSVDFGDGQREQLDLGPGSGNIVTRVWTPHPERPKRADSPVRALLNAFGQLEKLRLFLNSQLNSRLAWASLLPWPLLDFPTDDAQPAAGESVLAKLQEVMIAKLTGEGDSIALGPILAEMPLEFLQAMKDIKPITFESVLSDQAIALRKELRTEVSEGMNIPATFFEGNRNTNHWASWWGSEEFATKSISPIMNRVVDALTTSCLYGALKKLNKDPSRYTFWYDTAPLFNSADELTDAINLGERGFIGDATVRRKGNYRETDAPSDQEKMIKFLKEVVLRDPTLFHSPAVRELIGVDIKELLPALSTPPPPPPRPERGLLPPPIGSKPLEPEPGNALVSSGMLASTQTPVLIAANAVVVRALELAGKRLVGQKRQAQFPNTKPKDLHTKIIVESYEQAEILLASAFDTAEDVFDGVDVDLNTVMPVLRQYTKNLLVNRFHHTKSLLTVALKHGGVT